VLLSYPGTRVPGVALIIANIGAHLAYFFSKMKTGHLGAPVPRYPGTRSCLFIRAFYYLRPCMVCCVRVSRLNLGFQYKSLLIYNYGNMFRETKNKIVQRVLDPLQVCAYAYAHNRSHFETNRNVIDWSRFDFGSPPIFSLKWAQLQKGWA
jgi:hypothetical protein